jgi:hypothetical protein
MSGMRLMRAEQRPVGQLVLAVLAGALHLGVGWVFLARVVWVPPPVLVVLWPAWLASAAWLAWIAREGSWWTPAVPVVTAGFFALLVAGGWALFGWS